MKFIKTKIKDLIIIKPQIYNDNRGYFAETFRQDKLEKFIGYKINFCQENESKNSKGTLRGLHYQLPPFAQTKLIRVTHGRVLDVALDIRKNSPTFAQHISIELSAENKKQLLIPIGFAHGFVALEKDTVLSYKVDNYYNLEYDNGIAFNDKDLNIDWLLTADKLNISTKDKSQLTLKDTSFLFKYSANLYA